MGEANIVVTIRTGGRVPGSLHRRRAQGFAREDDSREQLPLQAIALLTRVDTCHGASSGKVRNFFGKCQHAFRVGPAIRENIDPSSWIISTVRAPARTVDIKV